MDRLRHEHLEFTKLLGELHRSLETITPDDGLLVRDACRRIGDLLGYVRDHEDQENDLVELVFTDDIGTTD